MNFDNNTHIDDNTLINNEHDNLNISKNNTHSDNNHDDDDDKPPPPTAAAMLIEADRVERLTTQKSLSTYFPSNSIYNIVSWLGSSIYSIATLPSLLLSSTTPEYNHEQILNTINKLNNHLSFLDKKIENMYANTLRYADKAKVLYKKKNMNSAIHQIKLKKMYDREIQKLESLKFNIESQILHMDSVEVMMVTVDTIKDTGEYYKSMHTNINISQLENTLDEMVEHRDAATDIQSILSDINTFSENTYDNDELLKELEEMTSNENNKENNKENITVSFADLPIAPNNILHDNSSSRISQSIGSLENIQVSF